jgi:hypothetical protein
MIPEFVSIAREVYKGADIRDLNHSIIGKEKSTSNKRQFIELRLRLNTLTHSQIELLCTGSLDEEKQITHLALSKAYQFYKDFVIEIIREKYQVYDFVLTDLDYNTFVSGKKIDHPELEKLTVRTQQNIRQILLKMLRQVDIVESNKSEIIHKPQLTVNVEKVVVEEDPNLLACFLYTDHQIKSLS